MRAAAAAAAIAAAAMTLSMSVYPFRAASLAAQCWVLALMLVIASPYVLLAWRAVQPNIAHRAFARGISISSVAIAVLVPTLFGILFLSTMSLWAEHPTGIERVGQWIGAVSIVPFGMLTEHAPRLRLSPGWLVAFVLANVWLWIATRLSRLERERLNDDGARIWRRGRRWGIACGLGIPLLLTWGTAVYLALVA